MEDQIQETSQRAQVIPVMPRNSRSEQVNADRRSSYNIEGYDHIQMDEFKEEDQLKVFAGSRFLDIFTIILVIIYTLLVFINFAFTSSDAANNSQIDLTLSVVQIIEMCILGLFCVEILMKIYASSLSQYFSDCWPIFDLTIILISIAFIILDWTIENASFSTVSKVFRGIFRFLRLFLVFRKFNQVKRISNIGTRYNVRSPIEKVLEILRGMTEHFEDPEVLEQLKWSIQQISNNTLYEPLFQDDKNKDAINWLQNKVSPIAEELKDQSEEFLLDQDIQSTLPGDLVMEFDERILKLDYDYFTLYQKMNNDMLVYLLGYLFNKHQLFRTLRITPLQLNKCSEDIAKGYRSQNPYHNVIHAFDVTHTVYFFLEIGEVRENAKLSPLDLAIMFISSAGHDLGHPGWNNLYLAHSRDPLALKYNDKSPLEQFHAAQLFEICKTHDLFGRFSHADYKYFRERSVNMILSTDNAMHGKDFGKLKARLGSSDFEPATKDKFLCMDTLLHAADISNPFKPWDNYEKWTMRVLEEFFQQGDKEKQLGLPVSMLCDRKTTNIAKSQIGFIDYMVWPYYETITQFMPAIVSYTGQIQENKKKWSEKIEYYQTLLNQQNINV